MADAPIPRTEADLLRNLFQDKQDDNSIGTDDFRDSIVSSKFLNGQAWEFDLDGEFTAAAPRFCPAGVRTQITIDGTAGEFGHPIREGEDAFWSIPEMKIIAPNLNDFCLYRIGITAQSVMAATNRFEIEVDVLTGTFPVIYQQTSVFDKGAGNPQSFNYSVPLFVGPDFAANGARIFTTPEQDSEFWLTSITGLSIYIASPAI